MKHEWEQVYNGLLMSNKEFRAFVLVLNGSLSVVENYRGAFYLLFKNIDNIVALLGMFLFEFCTNIK